MPLESNQVYTRWLNFKAKKRLITERKIKGRCELRERHWRLLERTWYGQFSGEVQEAVSKPFLMFLKYHPNVKDGHLRKIILNTRKVESLTEMRRVY